MFWLANKTYGCHVEFPYLYNTRRIWHFWIRIHLGSFRHITLPKQKLNILRQDVSPETVPPPPVAPRAKRQRVSAEPWLNQSAKPVHLHILICKIPVLSSYHMMLYPVQLTIRFLILVDGGCTWLCIILYYYFHVSTRSVSPLIRLGKHTMWLMAPPTSSTKAPSSTEEPLPMDMDDTYVEVKGKVAEARLLKLRR